jgi:hypothetical protein
MRFHPINVVQNEVRKLRKREIKGIMNRVIKVGLPVTSYPIQVGFIGYRFFIICAGIKKAPPPIPKRNPKIIGIFVIENS